MASVDLALAAELDRILRRVRDEILGAVRDHGPAAFTSESPPPGVSRRAFNTRCRRGLVRDAVKDGRSWSCSRANWYASRQRRPVERVDLEPLTEAEQTARDVEAALRFGGLRRVGT